MYFPSIPPSTVKVNTWDTRSTERYVCGSDCINSFLELLLLACILG